MNDDPIMIRSAGAIGGTIGVVVNDATGWGNFPQAKHGARRIGVDPAGPLLSIAREG